MKRSTGIKFGLAGLIGGVSLALYLNGSSTSVEGEQAAHSDPAGAPSQQANGAQTAPFLTSPPAPAGSESAQPASVAQDAVPSENKAASPVAAVEAPCKTFQFKVGPKGSGFSAEKMGQFRHRIRTDLEGLSSIDTATACLNVGKRTVKHGLARAKNGAWEITFGAVATAQSIASLSVCRKNAKRESPCKLSKNLAFASMGLDENGESDDASAKGFNSAAGQDGMSAQVEREMTRELAGESDELAFFEGWEAVSQ